MRNRVDSLRLSKAVNLLLVDRMRMVLTIFPGSAVVACYNAYCKLGLRQIAFVSGSIQVLQ